MGKQLTAAYEPTRSAVLVKDSQIWGVVGEFTSSVRKGFKLPEHSAGFEVHLSTVSPATHNYQPLSKFPSVTQDISLRVKTDTSYASVLYAVTTDLEKQTAAKTMSIQMSPVTIYQASTTDATKTITLRLIVTSNEQTLRDKDVTKILDSIAATASELVGAERI